MPQTGPETINSLLLVITACAALFASGCSDSSKVSSLEARINDLEKDREDHVSKLADLTKRQLENEAALSSMREKIVTKTVEVSGELKAASAAIEGIRAERVVIEEKENVGVYITPWSLSVSNLDEAKKKGHEFSVTSNTLRVSDFEGRTSEINGNGVLISVKYDPSAALSVEDNTLTIWSKKGGWKTFSRYRNLFDEHPLQTSAVFGMATFGQAAAFVNALAGSGAFRIDLLSLSDDGILTFALTNALSLIVGDIRGSIELTTNSTAKKSTVRFTLNDTIGAGRRKATSVDLGVRREDIVFLTVKDIEVRSSLLP